MVQFGRMPKLSAFGTITRKVMGRITLKFHVIFLQKATEMDFFLVAYNITSLLCLFNDDLYQLFMNSSVICTSCFVQRSIKTPDGYCTVYTIPLNLSGHCYRHKL
jgi:hypothetical protein